MFRISNLIELPVIDLYSGKVLGNIKSVILDSEISRILALVCKESIMKKYMKAVEFKNIISFDLNGVYIRDKESLKKMDIYPAVQNRIMEYSNIIDKYVINNNGDVIGAVRDICFDENSGKIISYEISEGYIDDIMKGRQFIECGEISRLVDFNNMVGWIK